MFRIGSLKRTIYPVGQGAFYVEQIITKSHRTIVVCDCGSSSEFECMDKCIQDFCNEIRDSYIDAVFVSHFDKDHYNGLKHILKSCKVKRIFFPNLSEEEKNYIYIKGAIEEYNEHIDPIELNDYHFFVYNFAGFIREYSNIRNETIAIGFAPIDISYVDFNTQRESERINISDITGNSTITSNVKIITDDNLWMYIPVCLTDRYMQNKLNKLLNDELKDYNQRNGTEYMVEDLITNINNKTINILERVFAQMNKYLKKSHRLPYEMLSGSDSSPVNINSLVILSCENNMNHFHHHHSHHRVLDNRTFSNIYLPYCFIRNGDCIYTGDFNLIAFGDELKKVFKRILGEEAYYYVFERVGMFQVPHHGSRHSFKFIIYDPCTLYFISAGPHMGYKHPSLEVINEITRDNPLVITTKESTTKFEVEFEVEFEIE